MTKRIQLSDSLPAARRDLIRLGTTVERAATEAGLDPTLLELVKIRASQLNGCAFCLDMHVAAAREMGVDERRLTMLAAWWETELYSEAERAALRLTEAITRLPMTQDVPEDVYTAATGVFSEEQFSAIAWECVVINAFNRLAVTSHKPLPD